jgi:hypothetical protein
MAKIKLKSKETKYVKLPDTYRVEHQTDKGALIANEQDEGEWFPLSYVKLHGDGSIEVADWLFEKSDLLSDIKIPF